MNNTEQTLFNDLCSVLIYHQANLTQDAKEATTRLMEAGVMENEDDWNPVKTKYDEMLEAYAQDHLPEGWGPTHDYWGAKCFCLNPSWNAPKSNTLFAGEKSGFYLFFSSFQALKEYTQEKLSERETLAKNY